MVLQSVCNNIIVLWISSKVRNKMEESLIYLLKYRLTVVFIHAYRSILMQHLTQRSILKTKWYCLLFWLLFVLIICYQVWKKTALKYLAFNNQTTRIGNGFLVGIERWCSDIIYVSLLFTSTYHFSSLILFAFIMHCTPMSCVPIA